MKLWLWKITISQYRLYYIAQFFVGALTICEIVKNCETDENALLGIMLFFGEIDIFASLI